MEIHPPIKERTTEQLFEIAENKEEWQSEVVKLAQEELCKRGIPLSTQESRRISTRKFLEKVRNIKNQASYTLFEKVLMVLLGPVLIVVFKSNNCFYPGEGFSKMRKQRRFYLLLGFALWFLFFSWLFR
jgi:predicted transcriptional regulator